jgi:serine protease
MKNKLYIFTIIFLSLYSSVYSQNNYYYYYKGQKIFLELDKSKLNLIANSSFTNSEISNIGLNPYVLSQDTEITSNRFGKVEYQTEPTLTEFYQKVNFLKTKQNIKNIGLYFKRIGAPSIGISNYFYVKLKNVSDLNVLQQFAATKKC